MIMQQLSHLHRAAVTEKWDMLGGMKATKTKELAQMVLRRFLYRHYCAFGLETRLPIRQALFHNWTVLKSHHIVHPHCKSQGAQ